MFLELPRNSQIFYFELLHHQNSSTILIFKNVNKHTTCFFILFGDLFGVSVELQFSFCNPMISVVGRRRVKSEESKRRDAICWNGGSVTSEEHFDQSMAQPMHTGRRDPSHRTPVNGKMYVMHWVSKSEISSKRD